MTTILVTDASDSDSYASAVTSDSSTPQPAYTLSQIVYQLTTSWSSSGYIGYWANSSISYALLDTAPTNSWSTGYVDAGAAGVQLLTSDERYFASLAFQLWSDLVPVAMTNITGQQDASSANITFNYSTTTKGDCTYDQWWANSP